MTRVSGEHGQGAHWDGEGVAFGLYSENATAVELCLFGADGGEGRRIELARDESAVWRGYVAGLGPGQRYGYRVSGPFDPARGMRFNANKLLLDPFARAIEGSVTWAPALFASTPGDAELDSAAFVPKSVVTAGASAPVERPGVPWSETVLYEANLRGFTMRHPALSEAERGRFRGMRNRDVIAYLKSLGVTSLELLPVHAFVDERFLVERGLRNFWGYNTLNFFAPEPRYLGAEGVGAFREMVDALHEAGIEVILDVVYNHTAEGGADGPYLCYRGIDNSVYYRLNRDDASHYVNDTGCGNTLNADHPQVRHLVLESLRYWASQMGVDGFRFDLATTLGRTENGFDPQHPLLEAIGSDATLAGLKLIAEPWDVGPGGYRLGGFPRPWAEWNDRFRDGVRAFWRGDEDAAPELARRVHGSSDLFEPGGRAPAASINYVASHDGFTVADSVSYLHRHNEANGEENQDGHEHNFSCNYGIEGPSDDPSVVAARRRHRLNLLGTVLLSQGTPMLLAGDELGNSQSGNNNAYAQDNETGWLDWSALDADPDFRDEVAKLIGLRRRVALFRAPVYLHGRRRRSDGLGDIEWLDVSGRRIAEDEWHRTKTLALVLTVTRVRAHHSEPASAAVLFNAADVSATFTLPALPDARSWRLVFSSEPKAALQARHVDVPGRSLVCCLGGGEVE